MKSELARRFRAAWHALTEIPGWPDAPRSARLRRFLPILLPCLGLLALAGWWFLAEAPARRGLRLAHEPLLELEREVSGLRIRLSDQEAAEGAGRAREAADRLLADPGEAPRRLGEIRERFAALGWDATFQTFEAEPGNEPEAGPAAFGSLTVLGRLAPTAGGDAAFRGLIAATEHVFAAGKRIDLTRLAIRADDQGRQSVEMNLRIAHRLPDEEAPQ